MQKPPPPRAWLITVLTLYGEYRPLPGLVGREMIMPMRTARQTGAVGTPSMRTRHP